MYMYVCICVSVPCCCSLTHRLSSSMPSINIRPWAQLYRHTLHCRWWWWWVRPPTTMRGLAQVMTSSTTGAVIMIATQLAPPPSWIGCWCDDVLDSSQYVCCRFEGKDRRRVSRKQTEGRDGWMDGWRVTDCACMYLWHMACMLHLVARSNLSHLSDLENIYQFLTRQEPHERQRSGRMSTLFAYR